MGNPADTALCCCWLG